jgi:hypothetical protein
MKQIIYGAEPEPITLEKPAVDFAKNLLLEAID